MFRLSGHERIHQGAHADEGVVPGFGESAGDPRNAEIPARKIADIGAPRRWSGETAVRSIFYAESRAVGFAVDAVRDWFEQTL
jgi:hypothetical protein